MSGKLVDQGSMGQNLLKDGALRFGIEAAFLTYLGQSSENEWNARLHQMFSSPVAGTTNAFG